MERFRLRMDTEAPWEFAAIFGRTNQFYLTGTMQDGVLPDPRDDEAVLWVRRSLERALDESLFPIRPMKVSVTQPPGWAHAPGQSTLMRRRCPSRCSALPEILPLQGDGGARYPGGEGQVEEEHLRTCDHGAGREDHRHLEDCVPGMLREDEQAGLGVSLLPHGVRRGIMA